VQRRSLSPYINVTPLVDVVLVLLIIFMVLTPKMLEKFQVKLPAVFHPDPKAKMSYEPVCVIITADGYYYIKEQIYPTIEALEDKLRQVRQETPNRRLTLKADASLEFGKIRPVLQKAKLLGFKGTGLVVGHKHKHKEQG